MNFSSFPQSIKWWATFIDKWWLPTISGHEENLKVIILQKGGKEEENKMFVVGGCLALFKVFEGEKKIYRLDISK